MAHTKLTRVSKKISNPNGDIVFVHGLGGDGVSTWTSEDSVGKGEKEREFESYFPAVFAADFYKSNVWSLDYTAHISKWSDNPRYNELERHCNEILEYLLGADIGKKPTIFICHSLGGIVVKAILRKSQSARYDRLKQLHDKTKAISFIATPHKGSKWANILNSVNSVLPFVRTSDRIGELENDNVYLESLSAWYRESANDSNIETQAFYEQRKTKNIEVVPHYSANPDVDGCSPIPINENHIDIAKPTTKKAPLYMALSTLVNFHLYDGRDPKESLSPAASTIPPQTVVIGIVIKSGKVLMVRRRNPTDNLTWQFVAGRLKVGQESETECILRELREETNVHGKIVKRLGETTDGEIPYRRIFYALDYLDGDIANNDPNENSDVTWVKVGSISQFVTSPITGFIADYLGKKMEQNK